MTLPVQVDFDDPFADIHTEKGQGSCTFACETECICACAGIAHAQLQRMALIPGSESRLPAAYKRKLQEVMGAIRKQVSGGIPDPVRMRAKGTIRSYALTEDVIIPIINYCRFICVIHDNYINKALISAVCNITQICAIDVLRPLSKRVGRYLSSAHFLCDVLVSITMAFDELGIDIQEEVQDRSVGLFNESRKKSYGFAPTRARHPQNTIDERRSREENDRQHYENSEGEINPFTPTIVVNLINSIVGKLVDYSTENKIPAAALVEALRVASVFFCVNPSAHRCLWDTCFIPMFYSDMCYSLRSQLSPDVLRVMEMAKTNVWDDGSPARWEETID